MRCDMERDWEQPSILYRQIYDSALSRPFLVDCPADTKAMAMSSEEKPNWDSPVKSTILVCSGHGRQVTITQRAISKPFPLILAEEVLAPKWGLNWLPINNCGYRL